MSLETGTTLGPYEILAPLGAGGMGEVYRARDRQLDRDVAVKVLPDALAHDPERLARFEREAKVLASLNHPNIAQIYGMERLRPSRAEDLRIRGEGSASGRAGGGAPAPGEEERLRPSRAEDTLAIVMELVEGPTLADLIGHGHGTPEAERLRSGPSDKQGSGIASGGGAPRGLSIDEALPIAKQIAAALEAAHEAGVIHRDLKPANIKVRADGTVKVLDFGLAKLQEGTPGSGPQAPGLANSPTITTPAMTAMGVILGTAAYMSPEQAKGRPVDKRTDIWAFGAVLYELLTGRRAFGGDDVSETLASVIKSDPDWDALPQTMPASLRHVLRACLQKNPRERLHDMADVRLAMDGAFGGVVSAGREGAPAAPRFWQRPGVAAGAAAALVVLTGLAVWSAMRETPQAPAPAASFIVTAPPSEGPLISGNQPDLAVSPDGSAIVYVVGIRGQRGLSVGDPGSLYVRRVDRLEGVALARTEWARGPFFSPDAAWIGYFDSNEQRFKKVAAQGDAAPVPIGQVADPALLGGSSWGPDDTIVFAWGRALFRVPADGGAPEPLLEPSAGDLAAYRWPQFLPGGRSLLVQIAGGQTPGPAVVELSTRKVTPLFGNTAGSCRYSTTGHILCVDDGTLLAVPFDLDTLAVTGPSIPLIEGVMTKPSGAANFDLASDGSLAYIEGALSVAAGRLVWVDRDGREELIKNAALADIPRLSPDGQRIAVAVAGRDGLDVHVLDTAGRMLRLTRDPADEGHPLWTPDGRAIVFGSTREGGGVFRMNADGTGQAERLVGMTRSIPIPLAWSADGTVLVFYESGGPTLGDIYAVTLGSGKAEPLLADPATQEAHPAVSPDGRWLAYTGGESGRAEVYVRPFPNVNEGRVIVSQGGGNEPTWSADGTELFYWSDETSSMMAVPVTLEPDFKALGAPVRLFGGDYLFPQAGRHYDVSPDGKRFLMVKPDSGAEGGATPHIIYIQRWADRLKAAAR